MASGDARPIPQKNVAFRVTFPIFDNDGDLVTGAASLDSEISKDGGTFADVTAEATEIATASGMYFLDLTATEMDADTVAIIVKTVTAGAKTTPIVLYPEEAGDIRVNVTQISDDGTAADNLELDYDGTGLAKANSTIGTVTTLTGHTAQTGDNFVRLGAPAGASVSADVAAVKADTAAILVDTGTTLDTKINDIQGATFSSGTDSLEAIRDRGDAAWTTGAGGSDRLLMVDTTIATLSSQTSFTLTAGSADDDAYNNCTIVIEDVSTAVQKAIGIILDYTGSTKTVTLLNDPAIFTMAATDKIYILAEKGLKPTIDNRTLAISTSGEVSLLAATQTSIDAIETDTADIQPKIGTPAADLSADIVAVKVDTAAVLVDTADMQPKLGTPAADVSADIAAVKSETALIVADTNELQTDDVPGLVAALNDISTAQVNTEVDTALTDIKLDKLINAAVTGTDVADNSIIADLVSKSVTSDYDDFVNTTDSLQAIRDKQTDIETDTAEIGAAGAGLTGLGGMSTVMKAEVNAEMVDVESVDLVTQPGQELPAANQTRDKMLAFVYKGFRNKLDQNATEIKLYNDDTSTVDQKATVSDDGTTYTRNELATGP